MNRENVAVEVKNLNISFGSFKAVNDVSFIVYRGEIFGFLGANGAGKTTTIRTICGLITPESGYVRVAGVGFEQGVSAIKSKIGYMSQRFTLYSDLSIYENIAFTASLRKIPKNILLKRIAELFDFVGLTYPETTLVKNLPTGIKQEVALIASILHDPEIIFLDEPTSGVAPDVRARFWELIHRLADSGKTVFVTTHYMDEAENCGRIALMHSGRIIALDTPENLKKSAFPGPVFEINSKEKVASGLLEKIREKNIAEVHTYGMNYHIAVDDIEGWNKTVNEFGHGIKPGIFTQIKPSMEDVFIRMMGNEEK